MLLVADTVRRDLANSNTVRRDLIATVRHDLANTVRRDLAGTVRRDIMIAAKARRDRLVAGTARRDLADTARDLQSYDMWSVGVLFLELVLGTSKVFQV